VYRSARLGRPTLATNVLQLHVCRSKMAGNGFGLGEGAETKSKIELQMFKIKIQMSIEEQNGNFAKTVLPAGSGFWKRNCPL
jgi:hypothetical protein